MHIIIPSSFILILHSIQLITPPSFAQKFDPYQLNGGLIAAVAGKNYVLIASDTRLTDGGYGIHSRNYLSGRIWSAASSSSSSLPYNGSSSVSSLGDGARWEPDGSLAVPHGRSTNIQDVMSNNVMMSSPSLTKGHYSTQNTKLNIPILIGSAGCASDCESLKRRFRLELDALECNFSSFSSSSNLGVQSVANLLQQVLYGRRSFPYYAFCVVAGIDNHCDFDSREGAVYVYDAIGSYERVAVGCSGTGREMLQPILDRLFSKSSRRRIDDDNKLQQRIDYTNNANGVGAGDGDIMSVPAGDQRYGVAGSLRPPVRTTVNCSWEEAVQNVARGFQAVAEREISVGDEVVICLIRSGGGKGDESGNTSFDVINFKLKKH